jgi:type I restriction enzyme, R subunit
LPHPSAGDLSRQRAILVIVAARIQSLMPPVDISDVMGRVDDLLDEPVAAEGYVITDTTPDQIIDLSRADFDALRERFRREYKHTMVEILKGALCHRVVQMVRANKTRISYQEQLQHLIDEYNSGARKFESYVDGLIELAQGLNKEELRAIVEQLTEEELALFDLLTRSGPNLSKKDRHQVKQVARDLLDTLKTRYLVLDWRKRQRARAAVRQNIEVHLEQLPKKYDRHLSTRKCDEVYDHIYDSYYGEGRSVYEMKSKAIPEK